jgi:hypothetical protein
MLIRHIALVALFSSSRLNRACLRMRNGRYVAPSKPGYSAEMFPESIAQYSFPDGQEWRST